MAVQVSFNYPFHSTHPMLYLHLSEVEVQITPIAALNCRVFLTSTSSIKFLGGTSSFGTLKFAGQHQFKISSSNGINLECTASAALVDGALDERLINKTLNCSALADQCLTDAGEMFPAKCVFPFIHNGRKFHACTDVGSPDTSR